MRIARHCARRIAFIPAFLIALAACSSSSSTGGNATDAGGDGATGIATHRAASETCPHDRGPGLVDPGCGGDGGLGTSACDKDSDCTTSTNGRCYTNAGGIRCPGNVCSYDGCFSDADCADNLPCACRSQFAHGANYCVTGSTCRVDADCVGGGASGLCSPSGVPNCQLAYFCRTANDTCSSDADCTGGNQCSYDTQGKRWRCATSTCLPVP